MNCRLRTVATLSLVLWPEYYLTEYDEESRISQELSAKTLSKLESLVMRMLMMVLNGSRETYQDLQSIQNLLLDGCKVIKANLGVAPFEISTEASVRGGYDSKDQVGISLRES